MRKGTLAIVAIALGAVLPATGSAAGGTIATTVNVLDGFEADTQFIILGNIDAPNKCQKFRPMELVSDGDVIDEGPSSRRGSWALAFEDKSEFGDNVKVRALKSKVGNDNCGGDSESFELR